jgi:hypothetical protein
MTDTSDSAAKRAASTRLDENPIPPEQRSTIRARTHEQKVELYLKTIAWFTGIVAAATVASFIAAVAIATAAAGAVHGIGY